jgi:hypothetical protein
MKVLLRRGGRGGATGVRDEARVAATDLLAKRVQTH